MSDGVAFKGALVVKVKLFQRLTGGKPGPADAALTAVRLAGADLALQAGREELLMGPVVGAGAFSQPLNGVAECWRL
jgi:hypothetical protein